MVSTTCTSLRSPLTNDGRSGRSMSRQVRMASSLGRPSRRKNEPGMRPAAYIRSSTSTVNGKKSKPSRGCLPAVVADSTTVSPSWASTDPAACWASRPVLKVISRVPNVPLSMTAVLWCVPSVVSVMCGVSPLSRVRPRGACAVVGLRSKPSGRKLHVPGATTEDRRVGGLPTGSPYRRTYSVCLVLRVCSLCSGERPGAGRHSATVRWRSPAHNYLRSPSRSAMARRRWTSVLAR